MASELVSLTRDRPWAEMEAAIDRDGAVIVTDLLSPDLLARMNAEFDAAIAAAPAGSRSDEAGRKDFHGARTKRLTGLATISPAFAELMEHPTLLAYADAKLRDEAGGYWMNTGQLMIVGPGEPAQVLHRDQGNWPHFDRMGPNSPEATVSCMIALEPFTEELGATRVIPGSHLWPDYDAKGTQEQTTAAVMPAGAGMLYSGKVLHGAGHNRTAATWRRGLHLSYVLGWLRPEEAHTLAVPYAVARRYSPKVQELLGYASYDPRPYVGGRLWLLDFDEARDKLVEMA